MGEGPLAPHLCARCGGPQPLGLEPNPFQLFGLIPQFELDLKPIENRFYEISRALHPDRFSAAQMERLDPRVSARAPEAIQNSLARMSAINQAFKTLKSPRLRREEALSALGFERASVKKSATPPPRALAWFELQDEILDFMDSPVAAKEKLSQFEISLRTDLSWTLTTLTETGAKFDYSQDKTFLPRIAELLDEESYLTSLTRDVTTLSSKIGGKWRA